jgi:hypothetical protein
VNVKIIEIEKGQQNNNIIDTAHPAQAGQDHCSHALAISVLQRRVVKVEARRTVKGASSAPDSVWYGPGE